MTGEGERVHAVKAEPWARDEAEIGNPLDAATHLVAGWQMKNPDILAVSNDGSFGKELAGIGESLEFQRIA